MTYLCLDIGNVLVKTDFKPFLRYLSKTLNITMEESQNFLNRTQKLHDLGFTRIADELHDHFKIRSPVIIEELMNLWNSSIDTADYIFDKLIEISKQRDLKIALLSNIGFDHVGRFEELMKYGYQNFYRDTEKYFSCHVGARKPSLIYYQSFLQLHSEFQGCGYIDDLQDNLNASENFGFRTFRFALDELVGDNYKEDQWVGKLQALEHFIADDGTNS
jgi:FMN phosphatase YigB (HAD superfamily)